VISLGLTPILATALACALAAPASGSVPSWTTYHRDAARSGVDPDSASPIGPSQAWQMGLDGRIYGQPLVYGSRVYVATENDSVYALDSATGAVVWHRSVGIPVPARQLPCGNIDPVGITSTPVIDPATNRIYAVADTWDATNQTSIQHELVGLNLADGSPVGSPVVVDPPGSTPRYQLQRAALALNAGKINIGFGGNDGDCLPYNGWLVAAPETGGALLTFEAESGPGHGGGAIWGAGSGPAIDSSGDIWAATGNGFNSGPIFDFAESVLKLDANLNLVDHWAPSNFAALDHTDSDLGSSEPLLLPGGLVFQIGNEGVGYLLAAAKLPAVGATPAFETSVCPGSYGGGVYSNGVIYVTCRDGVHALSLNAMTPSLTPLPGWTINSGAIGPPIVAGGLVWSAGWNSGHLYGLNPTTGATSFDANLGAFNHFTSPSAAGGDLFVANGNSVTAFAIATPPAPSPTTTTLSSSVNPSAPSGSVTYTGTVSPTPDSGAAAFTDAGAPVAGCGAAAVSATTGQASCTTSYAAAGSHAVVAAYSGDAYFGPSRSATLKQVVSSTAPSGGHGQHPPVITHIKLFRSGRNWTLTLTLSEPATIMLLVTDKLSGRKVNGRCRVSARRGRRCTLTVRIKEITLRGTHGNDRFTLRLRGLRRGRYTAILTARAGNGPVSRSYTLHFTLRRPIKHA
jgi:outer membrane protein assembly factor BamB